MTLDPHNTLNTPPVNSTALLSPSEIINAMIELRIQLAELEQQIQTLKPAFSDACLALNTDKIELERATITRKLTPGQWAYSEEILAQENWLKQLRTQFKQTHEPISGREVSWAIKLILPSS